ncbi:uncharacterized protein PHACADRAFT_141532 [Phanerochaete carnosa HHB-10118-sp]|uniref:Yeast cell wall synthesis Kre9/Knh1-like N-terminal domain-containing protein n=1 Tax=Phanerochaete carnosa (strain HHB-10118-sp) TaxID=650164 RepID=K5X1N4_PHACS|nr:uncharacterized protein PHACADRAFT_141532 [Phanerochaete carnosa HHB-10118-sp]EKM56687.1 hypothetical protein PHACADRAFT_141532 [Phanerochaete carnosa HHB-10118-sp]
MIEPVASTSWAAGQQQTLKWIDDGTSPNLTSFGNASFGIYTGNVNQQTLLQMIAPSVNVSATDSIVFTPDPTIGEDGAFYFIRAQSLTLMDPKNPTFPAEAFSALFTLTGTSGQFNATVQQEIDGTSTAPIGGPTPAGSAVGATQSNTAASPTTVSVTAGSQTASSASKSASPSTTGAAAKGNGARGVLASAGLVGTVAAFIGAMML